MKLSAVIITLNEEKDLPRALASLTFVDEIIVVDSGSTDQTTAIAKKANARLIEHPFASYADQRNFADSQAKTDWILSLDADVVIPEVLRREIKSAIDDRNTDAYRIGRLNIIWGKPISVADWGPQDDNHIWLYRKNSGQWQSDVHEQFIATGKIGQLHNHLIHYNYETISEFIDKINSYSELAIRKSPKVSWLTPIIDFGKRYFYKIGFTAGYRGLFLSYLQAVYYLSLKIKLRQKRYTHII